MYEAIVCRSMRGLCVLHFHIIFENYDIDAYTNIEGVVTELNPPYRRLKVVKTAIPFDDIYTIEMLGKDILL